MISWDRTAKNPRNLRLALPRLVYASKQERHIRPAHVSPSQHSRGGLAGRSARLAGETIKRQQKKKEQGDGPDKQWRSEQELERRPFGKRKRKELDKVVIGRGGRTDYGER